MNFLLTWLGATLIVLALIGLIVLGFWVGTALFSLSPVLSVVIGCAVLVGFVIAVSAAIEDGY